MTTANDGYNSGAGGKLRKKVLRKTTPYDQPITNPNPKNTSKSGFFSRLIYAVTCAFWRRNPAVTEAPVTVTNEEQRNLANTSATEISDIETMLKKKSLTRYEIDEISNNSLVLRLKASKSGPLNKHAEERENLHADISIPRAFQEDVASPVELAKARSRGRTAMYRMVHSPYYRGPSTLSKKPTPSLISAQPAWELEGSNGSKMVSAFQDDVASPVELAMARSRGRTALYRMARSPYYRGPSTLSKKPTPSLISSQPAWELEGSNGSKMAGKRRSSVQDDLGSGGPMCRIRQKADICSQGSSLSKHKTEFDSSAQRLLISSESEQKASKAIVENGETSMRNSGYAFVPTESTQMASKILEHLERTIPKEKPSSSRLARTTEKSATKLTSNLALGSLDKVESSKFLLSSQNNQKSEGQHRIEENGPQRFAVPLIVLSTMNVNSTAPVQGNAPTTNAPSTLALPAEPPQKKPAFQMSAPEDFEVSDDDNHSTAPPVQGNAPTTNAASALALPAESPQKKQMSAHELRDFEVSDDDNHSTAPPVQGNAPTTNAASASALPAEPPQKKQMSAHEVHDFEVSDDDNHSTAPPVQGNAPTTNAASALALPAEPPQKIQMSAHEDFEVSDADNHSTAPPVQGNAPTTNAVSTLALPAKPPQKKPAFQMSTHEVFEVLDDDNHTTAPVQCNAPTTNAVSTWSLPGYDDPPKKKKRIR